MASQQGIQEFSQVLLHFEIIAGFLHNIIPYASPLPSRRKTPIANQRQVTKAWDGPEAGGHGGIRGRAVNIDYAGKHSAEIIISKR